MQTVLIIFLVILVTTLSSLLYVRIRRERRERTVLRGIAPDQLHNLTKMSMHEGGLPAVAKLFSRLLRESYGCPRTAFCKKSGDAFELDHSYGLNESRREAWNAPCTRELGEVLSKSRLPGSVEEISNFLPDRLVNTLRASNLDIYFPMFWDDQLYGLYFLTANSVTRSSSFGLAVATIAQTLSAACNLKSNQDRLGRLQEKVTALEAEHQQRHTVAATTPLRMLKLVRHRHSEILVGRIVDEVRKDLDLKRYAFFFPPKKDGDDIRVLCDGIKGGIEAPPHEMFDRMLARLDPDRAEEVALIGKTGDGLAEVLGESLHQAGLKYVAVFPLSSGRSGLVAWENALGADQVLSRLRYHWHSVAELMENAELFEKVEELSYTDALTGLANQRYFMKRLDEEVGRARRYGRSLALIIFDLDELKSINDSYGHQAGDTVLRQMGEILQSSIRSIDIVARYGGDEFCIVMPEADRATCTRFMRRFQQKIACSSFHISQLNRDLTCTISQGGAVYPDNAENTEQLIYAADMALLGAKEAGRNQFLLG